MDVTGTPWVSAQITLSIEDFGSNDRAYLVVYKPDGSVAWKCSSYITVSNSSSFQNLKFNGASTGKYRVEYTLSNTAGGTVGSGRINCWIY